MDKPRPSFTIEELTKEALRQVPSDEEGIFTNSQLRVLWGCSRDTVWSKLDILVSLGWKITPAKKRIVDRAGRMTWTIGYKFISPSV